MRSIIKRDQVRVDEPGKTRARAEPTPGSAAADPGAARHAPAVRLLTLEAGLQALEFTCSCGEVSLIEIQCEKKP